MILGSGSSGMSALHYTAESPNALCAEGLLEARADPNAAGARFSPTVIFDMIFVMKGSGIGRLG